MASEEICSPVTIYFFRLYQANCGLRRGYSRIYRNNQLIKTEITSYLIIYIFIYLFYLFIYSRTVFMHLYL